MENGKQIKREELKAINIRVPTKLLERMSKVKKEQGIAITFQLVTGAEMFLKEKKVD